MTCAVGVDAGAGLVKTCAVGVDTFASAGALLGALAEDAEEPPPLKARLSSSNKMNASRIVPVAMSGLLWDHGRAVGLRRLDGGPLRLALEHSRDERREHLRQALGARRALLLRCLGVLFDAAHARFIETREHRLERVEAAREDAYDL